MRLSLLIVCLGVFAVSAGAGENGKNGGPLPANEWVKLEEGGLGPREGATLVYCRSIKRFLTAMGQQVRYNLKPTPPYSEMTFNFEKRRWENALPKGGESWGGITGAVSAPTFRAGPGSHASDMRRGKDGILRPYLRGGYGSHVFHLLAYDLDRERVLYGVDMEYDPVARVWTKLKTKGHPGTPNLPPLKLDKPVEPCWSQSCYDPVNKEVLLFGGTKVQTETASPGTWVYSPAKNEWRKFSLGSEELNKLAATAETLQRKAHVAVTACRNRYYRTELAENAGKKLPELIAGALGQREIESLLGEVKKAGGSAKGHGKQQVAWAAVELGAALNGYRKLLGAVGGGVDAKAIAAATKVREDLRRAATSLSPEPPPRCYSPMVFDPVSMKIVLFGGSGLSHVKSDTWLYDPKTRAWEERRPETGPSPRACHGMVYLPKAKKVALVGGWVCEPRMTPNLGFLGRALPPEIWTYDVKSDKWTLVKRWEKPKGKRAEHPVIPRPRNAPQYFAANDDDVILTVATTKKGPSTYECKPKATWACRVDATVADAGGTGKFGAKPGATYYLSGYASPQWYETAPPPDAKKSEAELKSLPVNKWVRRSEGGLKRPGYNFCSVAYDPDRDQILAFAGGHSTWHGTDVGRYSLSTDRWHIDQRSNMPLSFGYNATHGSYGFGFHPWMPIHTWGGYSYDTITRKLVLVTGMPEFTFTYDLDIGRYDRPRVKLPPGGSALSTKTVRTPMGVIAWTRMRGLWRLDPGKKAWVRLKVNGKLVAPTIDRSGMTWDGKRKKLLLLAEGLKGDVLLYDPEGGVLERREAKGKENAPKASAGRNNFRDCRYVPGQDLVFDMMGSAYLIDSNEWVKLKVDTSKLRWVWTKGKALAASHTQGLIYDSKRDLLWAVTGSGNRGVFVLRLDAAKARK